MTYRIAWLNKDDGTSKVAPKQFPTAEEAQALCNELNLEYPHMEHTVIEEGQQPQFKPVTRVTETEAPARPPFIAMCDSDPMPFGVHIGKTLLEVPGDYLDFINTPRLERTHPALADYIARNRKAINQDVERQAGE